VPGPRPRLGQLGSFLERGAATAAVADRLANPPSLIYQALGEEYWNWVKNEAVEKKVMFTGMSSPCQWEESLFTKTIEKEYPTTKDFFGDFQADLQAERVKITFKNDANQVTIHAEGGDNFAYKPYLDGEKGSDDGMNCQSDEHLVEGDWKFDHIAAGSVVNVLVANKAYLGGATLPPLYHVQIIVPN
jgi:hypothetical protein